MTGDEPVMLKSDWRPLSDQGFIADAGPYLTRGQADAIEYAFLPECRHLNQVNVIHGGCLITFLDSCMGWEAMRRTGCDSVTIQLDTHFLKSVSAGQMVICHATAVRVTRSVVFMQGNLTVGGDTVVSGRGIWKNLSQRPAPTYDNRD